MPILPNINQCAHIKANGVRSGSPAMNGSTRCYFHGAPQFKPSASGINLQPLDTEAGIQLSLMQILDALVNERLDVDRARIAIRGLQLAARNVAVPCFFPHPSYVAHERPEESNSVPTVSGSNAA